MLINTCNTADVWQMKYSTSIIGLLARDRPHCKEPLPRHNQECFADVEVQEVQATMRHKHARAD